MVVVVVASQSNGRRGKRQCAELHRESLAVTSVSAQDESMRETHTLDRAAQS